MSIEFFGCSFQDTGNEIGTFIKQTSEDTYDKVEYCIDQILELEENIIRLGNKFSSYDEKNKKVDKIVEKTENCKDKIAEYYEN